MIKKESYLKAWQERVGETTCHLDYNEHLKKANLTKQFKQAVGDYNLNECSVIDYGCGGALLAEYLAQKFNLAFYDGFDVCHRSIERSGKRLEKLYSENKLKGGYLKLVEPVAPMINKAVDFIFCLNVIQHMPDIDHLTSLMESFNYSEAKHIILNFRQGEEVAFCPTPYKTTTEINLANTLTLTYIDTALSNYKRVRKHGKKTDEFVTAVYECRL